MLSADTRLNENSLLILNFFLCCFYTWVKCKFLIMELIVSFPENIEVPLSQLKRFNGSLIDLKGLLKVEVTSFCFDNNLSFSSNILFFCILLFLFENYGLHAFQDGLELQSTLSFSRCWNLACLFTFATRFRCHLNLTTFCQDFLTY